MSPQADPSKPGAPPTWEEYARLAADAMGKLARGEITLSRCFVLLPTNPGFVSKDVHELITDVVSEVDYPHSGFRELLELLETGATEERIIEFDRSLG